LERCARQNHKKDIGMELLKKVFSAEEATWSGQTILSAIVSELDKATNEKIITTKYKNPDENYQNWKDKQLETLPEIVSEVIDQSIKLHHPKYIGHQVTTTLPLANAITHLGAHLNNGMAVYEMGVAASIIDRLMIEELLPYFGYDMNGSGIFTSGGTIANITALLCARSSYDNTIWTKGYQNKKLGFMVSAQAHYCIDRAVRIMGLGDEGMVSIPSNKFYKADVSLLEETYQNATKNGVTIIAIVGSAPSTATGMSDDLIAFGEFAQRHNLWYHIDAAHGGPTVLSEKYKHLMKGCDMANSITVDAHKMMMIPALTTMLFFKNHSDSFKTFAQEASYLFDQEQNDWSNYGKRTIECTKLMLGLRLFVPWKIYGKQLFIDYLEACYDGARKFAALLKEDGGFDLAIEPESNIICFRLKDAPDELIFQVRQNLLHKGEFYILTTKLKSGLYFRCTVMNAFTQERHFIELISEIKVLADELSMSRVHQD
jgi:L-2,4-diaminobutyrate decarboxylase